MTGFCKDCYHWDALFALPDGSAQCDRIELIETIGKTEPDSATILFSVSDDHGLKINLQTGPYFGCNRFLPVNP